MIVNHIMADRHDYEINTSSLINQFGRKSTTDAVIFVFGVIVTKIQEAGIEQPKDFDQVEEFIRVLSETEFLDDKSRNIMSAIVLKDSIVDHCVRGLGNFPGSFWSIFARSVSWLYSTWERSPRSVDISEYISIELTNLSKLCNMLNNLDKANVEGYAMVHHLMMDRLLGEYPHKML